MSINSLQAAQTFLESPVSFTKQDVGMRRGS